ncbi:phosphatidylglycerol lysyltransferase domain-containing protein [Mangrovibacterium lignilyticum]|uniref:phosphatidylglycerol lysyltransferase domain-containing protein n=1 Tax=Mangrovibacterium lignilyticum TaxID=2668052 RepID=UPI001968184D|nr:phosphatidylglycerol lysyltransferase domain-containing protein [Mangrovibacterium lignilyticum]
MILQGILAFLFLALAFYFIKHEQTELSEVNNTLRNASFVWVLIGMSLTGFFIFVQGLMYQFSFRSVGERITLSSAMLLFVKRNFISVFLPAGGISSLAFFTRNIEVQQVSKSKIHVASSIYAFVGIVSIVLVAIPALGYALLKDSLSSKEIYIFISLILLIALCVWAVRSIALEGRFYQLIVKIHPSFEAQYAEIKDIRLDRKHFIQSILISIVIEFVGIAHLLIAMRSLGYPLAVEGAIIGYIVSVMFLLVSPFLRGLGAIELSLSFILTRYGFSTLEAISVTFLYRFFEFWLLLTVGAFSFVFVRNNIFLRVAPVVLTFSLGVVNIASVLTPAIQSRLKLLNDFLPWYAIDLSNYAVFMVGIFLLLISAFLLRGVRMAWYLTTGLAIISIFGHLTKAIDYEEASLALFTVVALFLTRRQYFVRNNPNLANIGINAALIAVAAVLTYGIIGFYFLDRWHFNIDFSLWQSIKYTIQNFFFYQSDLLVPADKFAQKFLYSINISGGLTIGFFLYTMIRPYFFEQKAEEYEMEAARDLVAKHGRSSLDYFKTYYDKSLFFSTDSEAFVAYRTAGNYAVVLEDPVCANIHKMEKVIREFDSFCAANGMKSLYYRVSGSSLQVYQKLKKKSLLIGQEAILDLKTFTIEGKDKKSIRTSSNKQKELGLVSKVYTPPIKDGLIQKIHSVSNEWQKEKNYHELVFSQGLFDPEELKNQTLITVENKEEKILAFANIIPDDTPGEATYDLIRNAKGTPNGLIEFLMAEMFFYLKAEGYQSADLGFAAMAGIEEGKNFPEKSIRFAYQKLQAFAHYKGLKEFKDKFGPQWHDRYLIYTNDYDLFSVPSVLNKVVKP